VEDQVEKKTIPGKIPSYFSVLISAEYPSPSKKKPAPGKRKPRILQSTREFINS
jgi:hypothetical protein